MVIGVGPQKKMRDEAVNESIELVIAKCFTNGTTKPKRCEGGGADLEWKCGGSTDRSDANDLIVGKTNDGIPADTAYFASQGLVGGESK